MSEVELCYSLITVLMIDVPTTLKCDIINMPIILRLLKKIKIVGFLPFTNDICLPNLGTWKLKKTKNKKQQWKPVLISNGYWYAKPMKSGSIFLV